MYEDGKIDKDFAIATLILIGAGLLFVIGVFAALITRQSSQQVIRIPETETPRTVRTDYGLFDVPGSGYIDGRDVNAVPPLTLMTVNVSNRQRTRSMCRVPHGEKVEILDYDPSNRRFEIRYGSCQGWVTWWFVNHQEYSPVGEPIWNNNDP